MRKWLGLGLLGLAVAWGPYLYSELVRTPLRAHGGRARNSAVAFGSAESASAGAGDAATTQSERADVKPGAADPKAPAADGKPAKEPATPDDKAQPPAAGQKKAAAEPKPEPAEPEGQASAHKAAAAKEEADAPVPLPNALVPAFRTTFETEPRDGFWATDEEPRLTKLFRGAGVHKEVITEVACRKTVCRVGFNEGELDDEVEAKLYAALRSEFGTSLALDSKLGSAQERAVLYVLRKGYSLEPHAK